ncbi:hypothetical protein [Natronospora cellulosivora (SeqCode)]
MNVLTNGIELREEEMIMVNGGGFRINGGIEPGDRTPEGYDPVRTAIVGTFAGIGGPGAVIAAVTADVLLQAREASQ